MSATRRWSARRCILPVVDRVIPIIADEAVDPAFGTGAVKVTPAHDPVDFEIGQRHNLPIVNILDPDATMNENAGPYAGLDRFDCRKAIVADLEEGGLLVKIEPYTHAIGHCQRCQTVVEPLVSKQWFVKMEPLAEAGHRGRDQTAASRSCPSASPRSTSTGWRTSATGASAASSGGDTASRSGTAGTAAARP